MNINISNLEIINLKQKIYFTFLTVQSTRILNSKTNQLELSQETVLKEQQATKLNKSENQTEIKQIDRNEIYSFHFISFSETSVSV